MRDLFGIVAAAMRRSQGSTHPRRFDFEYMVSPPLCDPQFMRPVVRRIIQAVLYEIGAVALTSPILGLTFDATAESALLLATIMSTIALAWNYLYNALFERWEARQAIKGRSLWRRLSHGIGFEGGLVVMLVPLMAYWLQTSLLEAFFAELGILVVFLIYAIAFTWAFDKIFGLPQSAVAL